MSDTASILFAISDTGGGHRSGAVAIRAALEAQAGEAIECHIVDMLASTGVPFVRDAPELYDQLSTRWLSFYDFLYQLTNGQRRIDTITNLAYLMAHRNIVRVLDETRPNLVVSVHPLSNRLIGNARRFYRLSFRFVFVVTDLVTLHAAHIEPDVDLCVVPTEEAYQRMLADGMPKSKLARTGFPVHPKFAAYTGTQSSARAELGLAPDRFTVLVTSGGVGSGKLRELVVALDQTYPEQQILVVTGRNAALRAELEQMGLQPHIHLFGFVHNMEVLMAASDIIITKAGPGTLMEALVMRRPVIVTEAVGMQERGNIDFVLNHEVGTYCPTVERIVPAIAELMNPTTYAATVARLAGAVPREGAHQIARLLLEQLQLAPPVRSRRLRLPSMDTLRRTLKERRSRQPGARPRLRLSVRPRRLRLPRVRSLPRRRTRT